VGHLPILCHAVGSAGKFLENSNLRLSPTTFAQGFAQFLGIIFGKYSYRNIALLPMRQPGLRTC
jgi:hypothetical protein